MSLTKQDLKSIENIVDKKIDRKIDGFVIVVAKGFEEVHNKLKEHDKRFDQIDEKFDQNDASHRTINAHLDLIETDLTEIKQDLRQIKSDINNFDERLTRLEEKILENNSPFPSEVIILRRRLNVLEKQVKRLEKAHSGSV